MRTLALAFAFSIMVVAVASADEALERACPKDEMCRSPDGIEDEGDLPAMMEMSMLQAGVKVAEQNTAVHQHDHRASLSSRTKNQKSSGEVCNGYAAYPSGSTSKWGGTVSGPSACIDACKAKGYTKFTFWPDGGGCRCSAADDSELSTTSWESVSGSSSCCSACLDYMDGDCTTCSSVHIDSGSYISNGDGYLIWPLGVSYFSNNGKCVKPAQNNKEITIGFGIDAHDTIDQYEIQLTMSSDGKVKLDTSSNSYDYNAGDEVCLAKRNSNASRNVAYALFINGVLQDKARMSNPYASSNWDSSFIENVRVHMKDGATATSVTDVAGDCETTPIW